MRQLTVGDSKITYSHGEERDGRREEEERERGRKREKKERKIERKREARGRD